MSFQAINPPGPGIPGLSQAAAIDGGRLLLLSGHVPFRADGSVAGPDFEAQLEQVFSNLETTLKAAGSDFAKVAKLTYYITDLQPNLLATLRAVRDRFIDPKHPPASTLIGVATLFRPDVRVEIEAVATV